MVVPASRREDVLLHVKVKWSDIGGLEDVKKRIRQAVEWPARFPGLFKRMGITPPRGILLYGPPGCAKTTLVKAMATCSSAAFISVLGAKVYSSYLGEAEAILRDVFKRARANSPCVVFIDEIDSIVSKRSFSSGGSRSVGMEERILSTLLNEMDGVGGTTTGKGRILIVAATNRPDMLDAALLRPGRFDHSIYVPPPDTVARVAILRIHTARMPLSTDSDQLLRGVASRTEGYTGAELEGLCREAAMEALRSGRHVVDASCFSVALTVVRSAVSAEELYRYQNWKPGR